MTLLRPIALVCLVISAASPSSAQTVLTTAPQEKLAVQAEAPRGASKDALVGTWDLVLTFSDGSQAKSVLTVMSGRSDGEGSVLHAAEASLLLPSPTTMEQGVWAHLGHRQFVATYFGFAVNSTFTAPDGRIGFRQHQITVSANGETFRGTATFEVRDTAGVALFSDQVQTAGKRQRP